MSPMVERYIIYQSYPTKGAVLQIYEILVAQRKRLIIPLFNQTYMLESCRIFVDHQFNICSAVPQDDTVGITAVVSETRENDNALGQ